MNLIKREFAPIKIMFLCLFCLGIIVQTVSKANGLSLFAYILSTAGFFCPAKYLRII